MVATIVLLMLLGWLACTAAMTFRAGASGGIRESQTTGPIDVRRLSGAPSPSQSYSGGDGKR